MFIVLFANRWLAWTIAIAIIVAVALVGYIKYTTIAMSAGF